MTPELDPERRLALAYVPVRHRPAVEALWRLDVALGSVLATGREPMISRIRLAWWREALERLDRAPAPAEPVLQGLAAHVLPAGVAGAELAAMEEGWLPLTDAEPPDSAALDGYARRRGGLLFGFSARLLGSGAEAARGGEAWALIDLARHSSDPAEARAAARAARDWKPSGRWPRSLRPLGMLATLAARDADRGPPFEPYGAPPRVARMLRHRLTGY